MVNQSTKRLDNYIYITRKAFLDWNKWEDAQWNSEALRKKVGQLFRMLPGNQKQQKFFEYDRILMHAYELRIDPDIIQILQV